jgi:hypothetical protein
MQHNRQQHRHQPKLFEGLRPDDLKNMVLDRIAIDQYKSKMGNDEDIIVISFKVKDKFPAIDLMEFIEKGYEFILDADMSTGEESDGKYSVFVEFQRDSRFPKDLEKLLNGVSKLCSHKDWHFRYFKDQETYKVDADTIEKVVPLDALSYKKRVKDQTLDEVNGLLDQGTTEAVDFDENNNLTISKPYAGDLTVELEDIGLYDNLIKTLEGPIQLDESSNSQVLFLEKYLGNYEIYKINNKFLIKNGGKAIIINKKDW